MLARWCWRRRSRSNAVFGLAVWPCAFSRMRITRYRINASAKGNWYDNAAMESWNHSLRVEAIHGERFATREEVKAQVFEYIEVDYNRDRLHSTLGYVSLEQFERVHATLKGVRGTGARSNHLAHKKSDTPLP